MGILTPLDGSEPERLSSVIRRKAEPRRSRLVSLRPWLLRRYRSYSKKRDSLSRLKPTNVSTQIRTDCEHLFDIETIALAKIKATIVAKLPGSNAFLCPYCFTVKWESFDHFAPKSLFPEFSILTLNLIPACYRCNTRKGDAWTIGGNLIVLNLYVDEWPAYKFLELDLEYDDTLGATVHFRLSPTALGNDAMRMKSHFQKLDLLKLYAEAGASAITEYRAILGRHVFSSEAEVVTSLREEAEALRELYGVNYWKALIADSLASTESFVQAITPE
jgi:5-methylcytosine-specific restriction endonuclease McrA